MLNEYDDKYSHVLDLIEEAIDSKISLTRISLERHNTESYIRKRRNVINSNPEKFSHQFMQRYNELIGRYNNMQFSEPQSNNDIYENAVVLESPKLEPSKEESELNSLLTDYFTAHGVDLEYNKIKKLTISGTLNKDPRIHAVLEPKYILELNDFRKIADDFCEDISKKFQNKPQLFNISKKIGTENMLAMPALFDEHFGKLTHESETSEEFNIDVATKRHFEALNHFMDRMSNYKIERVFYPIGNDLFNSDTPLNTTSAGTPQDEQLRWKKTFKIVEDVFYKSIDMIAQKYAVDIYTVPGNHDVKNTFLLGRVLKAYYRNEEKKGYITVNKDGFDERARRYYKFGKNSIGLSHGDGEKIKDIPNISMHEFKKQYPKDWYETEFYYHFLGHLHTEKQYIVNDYNGFKMFHVPAMTGTDWWHSHKGYTNSRKMSQMFIFDKEYGLMDTCNFYVTD